MKKILFLVVSIAVLAIIVLAPQNKDISLLDNPITQWGNKRMNVNSQKECPVIILRQMPTSEHFELINY